MSTAIQKSAGAELQKLCSNPSISKRFEDVLGKKASAFTSSLVTIVNNSRNLSKCNPQTILSSAMVAATLDLTVDPNLGFAHIVPYKDRASFQMGYKGFIQLAQRSGQFAAMNDVVVPHGALKSFNPITGELVVDWDAGDDEGTPDGYAFYFKLVNGFEKTVFWSYQKVYNHAMRFSQAFRSGYDTPWKSDFDAMALKTVIKFALSRYAPLSVDMQRAVVSDQAVIDEEGNVSEYIDDPKGKSDEERIKEAKIAETVFTPDEENISTKPEPEEEPAEESHPDLEPTPAPKKKGKKAEKAEPEQEHTQGELEATAPAEEPAKPDTCAIIRDALEEADVSEIKFLAWAKHVKLCEGGEKIEDIPPAKRDAIVQRVDSAVSKAKEWSPS